MSIGQNAIGANFTEVSSTQTFELGTRMKDGAGAEFVYCQADGITAVGDVIQISVAYQADQITVTTSGGTIGEPVGVAVSVFADNDYGWIQVYGTVAAINIATSAAANTILNTTATVGRLDDDNLGGSENIGGLVTTASESSNSAAGFLLYPWVSDAV